MDDRITALQYAFVRAGIEARPLGFRTGWRRFPNVLATQIQDGGYLLEAENREACEIAPGAGFLIPPGMATAVRVVPGQTATTVYSHFHCRIFGCLDLFSLLDRPVLLPPAKAATIGRINRSLVRAQSEGSAQSLRTGARVLELGGRLVRTAIEQAPVLEQIWRDPQRKRLLPAVRYVRDHLTEPMQREALARLTGLSVPRFHVVFREAFGRSPLEYVREQRMQRARHFLMDTDLPVAEIALHCGFEDPLYFSRVFRRSEGVPPTVYRVEVQNA